MSPLPALIAMLALVLGFLGMRDLVRGDDAAGPRTADPPRKPEVSNDVLGVGQRISRAGLDGALTVRSVLVAKGCGSAAALFLASLATGLMPDRLAPVVLGGSAIAGFAVPDLALARTARRRHRAMVAALPDVLDLLAVSVQTGRGLGGCLADLARNGRGPLVDEMARAGEEMAWGSGQLTALNGLRERVRGPEIAAFVSTLERSRRLGSPLADQLRRQSATLRQDQRRAIEEEAARAAPKIQLVIALVLVPSVLLLIVAALAANADSLLDVGY